MGFDTVKWHKTLIIVYLLVSVDEGKDRFVLFKVDWRGTTMFKRITSFFRVGEKDTYSRGPSTRNPSWTRSGYRHEPYSKCVQAGTLPLQGELVCWDELNKALRNLPTLKTFFSLILSFSLFSRLITVLMCFLV